MVPTEAVPPFEAYLPVMLRRWAVEEPELSWRTTPGTLVMLDISGFTRLTERLASRGRAGAEELSDILQDVFGALLDEAMDEGCDLLKWGGDALLLACTGPLAAQRGARAAVRMRAALGRVGHLRTTTGRVVLRASTGVASGDLLLVLAGDPSIHRELLVLGPTASAVVRLEAAATAGQVLLDAATAAALEPTLLGEPTGPGRLLGGLPAAGSEGAVTGLSFRRPGPLAHRRPPVAVDLSQLVPTQLRLHLSRGTHEPEHRVAATAFIRFDGTDALLGRHGPAGVARAADELVRNVQDATQRHGVSFHESDVDVDGGKIMLVAGAPLSSGDDVDHILAAVRLVVDRAGDVAVRAGVAQGRVFAGGLGPPTRRTYSVKGGAVNLAARLAARAAPRQVRVPVELLDHSRTAWQHSDRITLPLKGIRDPVATVALGQPRAAAVDAGSTVLVGRVQELTQIRAALDRLGALQGGSLVVIGEPGMGKTRLVAEVVSEADDFRVLSAECGHSGANSPYAVVRSLLAGALGLDASTPPAEGLAHARSLLADLDPDMVDRVPLLGAVFDVALPEADAGVQALAEEFRTEALHRLVVDVLRAVLLRPTVLVVEDTHLMDRDSGRLLDQLLARSGDRPWLLLTTRRDVPEGWTVPYGQVITLGPLDPAAAQSMTEVVLPEQPLTPAAAQALVARAGGHPLFLRELVLAASRGEQLDELPMSVEELVTVQIDSLPPVPRGLLRRAAVLGDTFPESLLQEVVADGGHSAAGVGPGAPLRDQLQGLGTFLVPESRRRWRFRHTVHREVAYAGLPVKVRARLHARVGDVLARSPHNVATRPEVMARHYLAAGRFHDAWVCARLAGAKAMEHAAPEAAAQAYARAAEAGARSGTVPDWERAADVEAWADALFLCGRSTDSDRAYAQARRLVSHSPARVAALALKRAKVAQRQGRHPVALRRTTTGLRALQGIEGPEPLAVRARLLARRSVIRMSQGRYAEARSSAHAALDLARLAGQEDAMAQAHLVLHGVEVFTGGRTGEDHGAAALHIYEQLGDLSGQAHAHNNLAMRLLLRGDWPEALQRFQQAAKSFEEVGDAANAANAAYNSADLLNRQGRSAEALSVLGGVLRIARAVDDEELYALALREQGRAHVRAGRGQDGLPLLERSRELFRELHEPHEVCDTDIALAEGHLLAGDPAQALESVEEALVVARRLGAATLLPSALRVRASAQTELGDVAGARDSLDQGLAASAAPELAHERGFLLAVAAHLASNGSSAGPAEASAALAALGVVRAPLPWAEWGEAPDAPAASRSGHG